jgi:ABC-type transport system substrate-binding protein
MIRTGEIDISEFSYERLPSLEAEGFDIIRKPTGTLWTILFTEPYKDPILCNPEVRKAIAQSIDYESFNQAFFSGAGDYINDGGNLAQCIDPRGVITRDPVPYDLEAAKATVARLVPSDYRLQFIGVIRGVVENQHVEALAGMIERAGFDVDIVLHDYATFRPDWQDGKIGAGVYLKDGRKNAIYYPTIYGNSPEGRGRHQLIDIDLDTQTVLSDVEVNPDIPWEHLKSIKSMDNMISGDMVTAKSWDEYWAAYSKVMDHAIENVAPGSGFLFTNRIFAADPAIMPTQWDVNLGWDSKLNVKELAVVPPEFEDAKYHPVKYEGER